MGYKLATQTGVGQGKTMEAGLIVAAMVAGRVSPGDYLAVLDGHTERCGSDDNGRRITS
ncbi:hypothetical protein RKD26_006835 [Streptomyces calvus]|jgi:hypothetical protein|uniref:hypothetical protein n=1 Tax=Streptomyces calvus TaxID=67282 RepID=UPI00351315AA